MIQYWNSIYSKHTQPSECSVFIRAVSVNSIVLHNWRIFTDDAEAALEPEPPVTLQLGGSNEWEWKAVHFTTRLCEATIARMLLWQRIITPSRSGKSVQLNCSELTVWASMCFVYNWLDYIWYIQDSLLWYFTELHYTVSALWFETRHHRGVAMETAKRSRVQ